MKVVLLAHVGAESGIDTAPLATPLHDPSTAATLPRRGTELVLTDGPFAGSVDPLVALEEIDVTGVDEAIRVAAGRSAVQVGSLEVRQVHERPDDRVPLAPPAAPAPGALPDRPASPLTPRSVLTGDRLTEATPTTSATVRARKGELLVARRLPDGRAEEIHVARPHPTQATAAVEIRPLVMA